MNERELRDRLKRLRRLGANKETIGEIEAQLASMAGREPRVEGVPAVPEPIEDSGIEEKEPEKAEKKKPAKKKPASKKDKKTKGGN